jgi:hypothetical protein
MGLPGSPRHYPTWGEYAKQPSDPEAMYWDMRPEEGPYVMAGDNTHYGWSELNCELGMKNPVGIVILRGVKMGSVPAFMHGNCIMERDGTVWIKETIDSEAMVVRKQRPRGGLRWA